MRIVYFENGRCLIDFMEYDTVFQFSTMFVVFFFVCVKRRIQQSNPAAVGRRRRKNREILYMNRKNEAFSKLTIKEAK